MSAQPAEVLTPDILGLIKRLYESLERSGVPYAFGGALALAWCIPEPRSTRDVDINIFIDAETAEIALAALPSEIVATETEESELRKHGQTRLRRDTIPVDIFLTNDPFHNEVATRVVRRPFLGKQMPFLCCSDIALFKAFFDRRKDWFDLSEMFEARSIDLTEMTALVAGLMDPDDHRIAELRKAHDDGERTRQRRAAGGLLEA